MRPDTPVVNTTIAYTRWSFAFAEDTQIVRARGSGYCLKDSNWNKGRSKHLPKSGTASHVESKDTDSISARCLEQGVAKASILSGILDAAYVLHAHVPVERARNFVY